MKPYMKAVVSAIMGGVIAFLSSLLTALQGQSTGFDTITAGQWVTALLAFFIGLGATGGVTYRVPNQPGPASAPVAAPAAASIPAPAGSPETTGPAAVR